VLIELTERAVKITQGTATRLLVNDRADVAAATGADGVHLATDSLDAAVVRRSFGERFLIGASTHTRDEAYRACDQGANFVVFGPVFPTPSKYRFGQPVGLSKLHELTAELGQFPVLALGGISIGNAAACLSAGAKGIAGISLFQQIEHLTKIATTIRHLAKGVSK
jgi:thiamine-phosphate pyrophosphorylase